MRAVDIDDMLREKEGGGVNIIGKLWQRGVGCGGRDVDASSHVSIIVRLKVWALFIRRLICDHRQMWTGVLIL